jgi:hypothetical protein
MVARECQAPASKDLREATQKVVTDRLLDLLQHRTALGGGRAIIDVKEIAATLHARWPGGPRPTPKQIKRGLRVLTKARRIAVKTWGSGLMIFAR